jgi:hypothetical protein|tara:strand:- start:1351 stop:1788 length:438 start_codon:yes stop_codon:yes gene_type:complete
MALPVTEQLTNQLQTESVGEVPDSGMEGNVTRSGMIGELISSLKDVHFSQLVNEFGNIAGMVSADKKPMTTALMAEREQVPQTPLKADDTTPPVQPTAPPPIPPEEIKVPTPMSDAMAMTKLSPIVPTGSVVEQNNGLMTQSKAI